jgi:cell division protein FtsB
VGQQTAQSYSSMAYNDALKRAELSQQIARSLNYRAPAASDEPLELPQQSRHQWFYALVTLALFLASLQSLRAIGTSALKVQTILQKTPIVEQYYNQAQRENKELKSQIKRYSSAAGIEELARNNLDMVGVGDILVRLY